MNSCPRPCSPSDMDEAGRCKCDREAAMIPKVQIDSLIGKIKKNRDELRQMERDYLDLHSMKFIPFADALCSMDAALKKLENFAKPKTKNTMDEITLSFSPDEFVLIANLVRRCHEDKGLRNSTPPMHRNENPFFLSRLWSKISEALPNASVGAQIMEDGIY